MNKNNFGMGQDFRNKYELFVVLVKNKGMFNFKDFPDVFDVEFIQHNDNTHPHTKSMKLIKKIIEHSSNENDIVFDPTCGSGIVPYCSMITKRNYVACEIDKKWYDLTTKRLQNVTLF
jgi:site-specific DNA-methyltransferase (adenine-specific)